MVRDILIAKVWQKVSSSVINALHGVNGKLDTIEAYEAHYES